MAGVKKFDRDLVLERATRAFWKRGYSATSISDLVKATGINRGSLYATFGDKERLFLSVLDHYAESVARPLMAELAAPDPRAALKGMFEAIIRRTSDSKWPPGCLFTNTSLECPGSGEEIRRTIARRIVQQEAAIFALIRRAQEQGALDPKRDARALARFFVGVAHGLNVANKASAKSAVLRDMVKVALGVWDGSGARPSENASDKVHARERRQNGATAES